MRQAWTAKFAKRLLLVLAKSTPNCPNKYTAIQARLDNQSVGKKEEQFNNQPAKKVGSNVIEAESKLKAGIRISNSAAIAPTKPIPKKVLLIILGLI